MFHTQLEKPLPCAPSARYRGLCYDGCYFYCTDPCARTITQMSTCFETVHCFEVAKSYTCLCYDSSENCFWAAEEHCPAAIFKLDTHFREIDCLRVCLPCDLLGVITGISYQCCRDTLLLSCGAGIVEVEKLHPQCAKILTKSGQAWMLTVVALCPYYLCCCLLNGRTMLRVYGKNGELLQQCELPRGCSLEAAVFYPDKKDFGACHFYVLLSKCRCYPAILDCVLDLGGLCRNLCPCNYALCGKKCHGTQHPHPDPGEGCGKVLESIAYMEAALAHILNAEGEKLQKIIADSDNVCEILEANASVQKTMERATHLEMLLCNKLETLSGCCDFSDEKPCCKPPCSDKPCPEKPCVKPCDDPCPPQKPCCRTRADSPT
ncbi:MAG: hypothetical protein RSC89_02760 [Oscillospiraceae bacterium]